MVSSRVKEAISCSGLTHSEVANYIGLHESSFSHQISNKSTGMQPEAIERLAGLCEVRAEWLTGESDLKTEAEFLENQTKETQERIMSAITFLRSAGLQIELIEKMKFTEAIKLVQEIERNEKHEEKLDLDNFDLENILLSLSAKEIKVMLELARYLLQGERSQSDIDNFMNSRYSFEKSLQLTPLSLQALESLQGFIFVKVCSNEHEKIFTSQEFLQFVDKIKEAAIFAFNTFA